MKKEPVFFEERALKVGRILAEAGCELWVNSDKGMLVRAADAYRAHNGKKLVVLYPEKGEPWPNKHTVPYTKKANEVRKERNWFWSNYNVVSLVDICVCVGLSAGTLSELAYIKWNCQFKCGKLGKLIGIRELLREEKFPLEIEIGVGIITYLDTVHDFETATLSFCYA
jgi:hypothetical protein